MKKSSKKITKKTKTTTGATKKTAAKGTAGKKVSPSTRGRPKKADLSTGKESVAVVATTSTPNPKRSRKKINTLDDIIPLEASLEESKASTYYRRNKAGTIEQTNRFQNINDGLIPFKHGTTAYGQTSSSVSIKEAVVLCQKCYYNFAVFRNVIDLMTEFSSSSVYFRGGNKKSRKFFEAFFKKINLWNFQEKFFREYYRSGNVFIYRFDVKLKDKDIKKITQTFGAKSSSNKIPVRYVILNPADISMSGNISFDMGKYFKVLTNYELERLRSPQTEEDKQVLQSLPSSVREQISKRNVGQLMLPLVTEKVHAVFYKKQDYEPFSVPMGYPVLDDINWKAEMKKMDMAIARTMQQAILLVTMGAEPEKGGINQKNLNAMQKIFDNESVGRVLIADYTTKAEFVIPNIAALLDAKKYEVVNNDIKQGLNNVLVGDDKFANQHIKVKVFIERLKQAREAFINDFLYPEMRRISKDLGFRSTPTPHFEDIDIKDAIEYNRIYTRLVELGILTPEEGMKAIETGQLPDAEGSVASQEEYKALRDRGFYEPMVGGPETQKEVASNQIQSQEKMSSESLKSAEKVNKMKIDAPTPTTQKPKPTAKKVAKENGRPQGTGTPQKKTRKSTPIGAPKGYGFSLSKIKEAMILTQKLESDVQKELKKIYNIKRISQKQKQVAEEIYHLIIANESPEDWFKNVEKYCQNPIDHNENRIQEVQELALEHQIDYYLASILCASKCNQEHEEK